MRIFKTKVFAKFARREGTSNEKLIGAIKELEAGNIDADYGGGVVKQRVSRPNDGKSGGYRTIIVHRHEDRAFFVFGYAKSVISNIDDEDVKNFKQLAKELLSLPDEKVETGLKAKQFVEIKHEKDKSV